MSATAQRALDRQELRERTPVAREEVIDPLPLTCVDQPDLSADFGRGTNSSNAWGTQVVEATSGTASPFFPSRVAGETGSTASAVYASLAGSELGRMVLEASKSPTVQIRPAAASSPGAVVRGLVSSAPRSPSVSVSATPAVPWSPQISDPRIVVPFNTTLLDQYTQVATGALTPTMPTMVTTMAAPATVARKASSMMAPSVRTVETTGVVQGGARNVFYSAAPAAPMIVQPPQEVIVQPPVEANPFMLQEKVSAMLQQERSSIYVGMQEMIAKSMKSYSESINAEFTKVMSMVNAVSTSCDERLVRLEVDRAARSTTLQGYKRDIDGMQQQISELTQSKSMGSDFLAKEREDLLVRVDSSNKDFRSQYRSLVASINSQREDQAKVDQALVELRNEQRSLQYRLEQKNNELVIQHQGLQTKCEKSVGDLRMQVNQSLQGFFGEVESLRSFGSLQDRLVKMEDRSEELRRTLLDLDVVELTRFVRAESQARIGISESLDAYRNAYLQTTTEIRAEVDGLAEKQARAGISTEDRSKILALERSIGEVRSLANARNANSRLENMGDAFLSKDIQDLHARVNSESTARLDLSQSLDAYRNAYLQTTTELRAELDMALEKLARLESTRRTFESNARREKAAADASIDPALPAYSRTFEVLRASSKDLSGNR